MNRLPSLVQIFDWVVQFGLGGLVAWSVWVLFEACCGGRRRTR